jgi:MFS family permease
VLAFLQGPMRLDETAAQLITGAGALLGMVFFVLFGRLSDRIGHRKPIVIGYGFTLVMLFPLFWIMGSAANPALAEAARRAPVIVSGPSCTYDPFAKAQADACGQILDHLSKRGVTYSTEVTPVVSVSVGGEPVLSPTVEAIDAALHAKGYSFDRVVPAPGQIATILLAILGLSALSGATYGPVAAALSEMFPPRIRYSSLSIPYHIGTGYFGGFLPLISQYIAAKAGDPYAGLWYTFAVVAMALAVSLWGLRDPEKLA